MLSRCLDGSIKKKSQSIKFFLSYTLSDSYQANKEIKDELLLHLHS